jgi:formylglycine-generating enzyme
MRTKVGEFENSASAYGTFDQNGNVWEFNESLTHTQGNETWRGLRGGSFYNSGLGPNLEATGRLWYYQTDEESYMGFRVVQAVPEPSSVVVLATGLVSLVGIRRRRT